MTLEYITIQTKLDTENEIKRIEHKIKIAEFKVFCINFLLLIFAIGFILLPAFGFHTLQIILTFILNLVFDERITNTIYYCIDMGIKIILFWITVLLFMENDRLTQKRK